MNLEFSNQLSNGQIVELINYVLTKGSTIDAEHPAKQVGICNEPNRCDELGNQELYVTAWDGNFYVGSFFIQDFTMKESKPWKKVSYDSEMREFMTSIFGEAYIEKLKEYYDILAMNEYERLRKILGVGR